MGRNTKKIEPFDLSPKQVEELAKVVRSPFFFSLFIYVVNPILGRVQFRLYPYQIAVLREFVRNQFNIVLKGRQMGLTELIAMYSLWLAMYHPNKNVQIISLKDKVAKRLMRRIKYMYRNLPAHLQVPVINGRSGEYGTAQEMEFSNGSTIMSIPTTEDAGRSEAVTLLILDEAAMLRFADEIWAAALPTLSTGGSAIMNSCITGDTEIVGRSHNFRVGDVAPKEFGIKDISHLGLEVLSHTGHWRKVLGAVNKGELETWEVEDNDGNILKCTPAHRLYTTRGWRTVRAIIKGGLNIIKYDPGISEVLEPPTTKPPAEEKMVRVKGFPKYMVSNMGHVYYNKSGTWVRKKLMTNPEGYYRVSLHHNMKKKKYTLSKLVAEHFIGHVPESYVVDHIDCDIKNNHVNNLQIITRKENATRAVKYSRGLALGNKTGAGFANIELTAMIRELYEDGYNNTNIVKIIEEEFGLSKTSAKVTVHRVIYKGRTSTVQISKLKLNRKFIDTIYDISVEEDESYVTNNTFINHNTPYGIGNLYHKTWVNAMAGRSNGFMPIRLHWNMHPDRGVEWYRKMAQALGPRRTAQEIDGDFLSSGFNVFDLTEIKVIEEMLSEVKILKTRFNSKLRIIKLPRKDRRYTIGADIASGRASDYSAFSIMDQYGNEVAYFKGRLPVDRFADLLMEYGKIYNMALLAPEANDIGMAVVSKIQESGYQNLYYTEDILKEKGKRKKKKLSVPGWLTTKKNRPVIIDVLSEDIRNDEVDIVNPFFCEEAYTFIYDSANRPIALGKGSSSEGEDTYTDDSIMATAITNYVRKINKINIITAPV